MTDTSAHCLCGVVKITATKVEHDVHICHCTMCRRWSGGPAMSVDCGEQVVISGNEYVSIFDSSDWAQRGFCKLCGSHLFYRLKGNNQYILPVGLFENLADLQLSHQFFIDEKPAYYSFTEKTRNLTGAQVFALYGPPPE